MLTLCSQDMSKQGASSADWAATVSEIVGGKAGGKAPTSVGNGTQPEKVDEALAAASRYLEKLKL